MKNPWPTVAVIAVLIAGALVLSRPNQNNEDMAERPLSGQEVTVYKTLTCGCCEVYAKYLEREEVNTKVVNVDDLTATKSQYGVPQQVQSCHTSLVGGYVVEGHIPLEIVEKLLVEKPAIKGIALPGMPSGSPGMPGPKTDTWTIFAFAEDGTVTEWMKY